MKKIIRVLSFFVFPLMVYLLNIIFYRFMDVCLIYPWVDIPMHFFGGFTIGFSFVLLFNFFEEENLIELKNKILFVFIIVSIVGFIAVLWEFYEFLLAFFGIVEMQTWTDTLSDLLIGIFGGFCISFWKSFSR
ncbi:MAG: hypothetical protein PVJ67_05285 [Candidatus Pacearchaeota archaeon]|jgi:hypothetical protein